MSLNLVPNWQTITPVIPVDKVRTHLDLPVFSYDLEWRGASEIITQFNFTASQNFVLRSLPTKPAGVNYCLCIRYRVGANVYRWKLWEGVDEVLNVPLYTNEVIKKNFVLEVWSVSTSTTVLQATALRIYTSILVIPADFYDPAEDISEATGAEFSSLNVGEIGYATPSTEVVKQFWFKSDSGITKDGSNRVSIWAGDLTTFNQASGAAQPLFVTSDPLVLNNYPFIKCEQSRGMLGTPDGTEKHLFLVFSPWTHFNNDYIWQSGMMEFRFHSTTFNVSLVFNIGGITDGNIVLTYTDIQQWFILDVSVNSSFLAAAKLYNIIGTLVDSDTVQLTGYPDWDTTYVGGGTGLGVESRFLEMIGYNAQLSESERAKNIQYFKIKYGGFTLPLTFDSGGPWLDNV